MSGISTSQLQQLLGAYNRKNNREVVPFVYGSGSQLAAHCKTLTKVNGKYPIPQAVGDHVVQAFRPVWDEMGGVEFRANELTAYRQKVNFPIIPDDVYASWIGDLYTEGKKPEEMPISQWIMQRHLGPKVKDDVRELEIKGVYGANNQAFGASMNGIVKVLADGVASTDQPMFRVPINNLTESNIVDEVIRFEKIVQKMAPNVTPFLKKLFVSKAVATNYKLKYEQLYGVNMDYTAQGGLKSKVLGLEIIGLDYAPDTLMFTTAENNMLRLIDTIDSQAPAVTDVQTVDYKVKVFMEFTLGYGFAYNQMVFVATYSGASGLAANHGLYY